MNFKLIGVTILIAVIGIFSYYISTNSPQQKPQEESVVSYFEKNQECFESKNKILQEIEKINNESWDERLIEIFYSPRHDSCLYVSEVTGAWSSVKRLMDYKTAAGEEPVDLCEYIPSEAIYKIELDTRRENNLNTEIFESAHARIQKDNCIRFDELVKSLKYKE